MIPVCQPSRRRNAYGAIRQHFRFELFAEREKVPREGQGLRIPNPGQTLSVQSKQSKQQQAVQSVEDWITKESKGW